VSVPGLFLSVLTGSTSIAGNDPFTPGAIPLYEDDTPKLTPLSSMRKVEKTLKPQNLVQSKNTRE
jgi:hypothetical protein